MNQEQNFCKTKLAYKYNSQSPNQLQSPHMKNKKTTNFPQSYPTYYFGQWTPE